MVVIDCVLWVMLWFGDYVVIFDDVYGGIFWLIDKVFIWWDVQYMLVWFVDLDVVGVVIILCIWLIWVEMFINLLLLIVDIMVIVELGIDRLVKVLVDNIFVLFVLQQLLWLGVDVVLYLIIKYIGGYFDVVGGVLVINDEELDEEFVFLQNGVGVVFGLFDVYLIMCGLKILVLWMQWYSENVCVVVEFFVDYLLVSFVLYLGLFSYFGYEIVV